MLCSGGELISDYVLANKKSMVHAEVLNENQSKHIFSADVTLKVFPLSGLDFSIEPRQIWKCWLIHWNNKHLLFAWRALLLILVFVSRRKKAHPYFVPWSAERCMNGWPCNPVSDCALEGILNLCGWQHTAGPQPHPGCFSNYWAVLSKGCLTLWGHWLSVHHQTLRTHTEKVIQTRS